MLKPTGTVLDRLVLCSIESVWFVHVHPGKHEDPKEVLAALREDEQEITALLIQYASPIAAATLPRFVNSTSDLQAASPAYESARLFRMIGVGVDVLRALRAGAASRRPGCRSSSRSTTRWRSAATISRSCACSAPRPAS